MRARLTAYGSRLDWLMLMMLPVCSAWSQAPVEIIRDGFGVPHVFGGTAAAVMLGSGYAMAEDRLADIEMTLRRANGRLAAIEGTAAVASDRADARQHHRARGPHVSGSVHE